VSRYRIKLNIVVLVQLFYIEYSRLMTYEYTCAIQCRRYGVVERRA